MASSNIGFKWQNMCGKVCSRRNTEGQCDLYPNEDNSIIKDGLCYCRSFKPNAKVPKSVLIQMWQDHGQHWIPGWFQK